MYVLTGAGALQSTGNYIPSFIPVLLPVMHIRYLNCADGNAASSFAMITILLKM